MSINDFPFNVGSKVRREQWGDKSEYVTITAIGLGHQFLGVHGDFDMSPEHEQYWMTGLHTHEGPWVAYAPPPVRRRWTFETEERVTAQGDVFLQHGHLYTACALREPADVLTGPITEVTE